MRRLKRSTALLQCSRNCLRGCRGSLNEPAFARTKSRQRGYAGQQRPPKGNATVFLLVAVAGLVQPQNLLLACSVVRSERRIIKSLRAHLPQRAAACRITSTLTLLPRNDTHAQNGKGYCYCPGYCRFNGEFHDGLISRSCGSDRGFLKELPPSAAKIEGCHAVHQKRIVVAAGRSGERAPNVA